MDERTAEDVMYNLGVPVAHSSDEGGMPDVGMSLGLGGKMLYAGEIPGKDRPGWWLVIYPKEGEREIIGSVIYDKASALMDALSAAIQKAKRDARGEAHDVATKAIRAMHNPAPGSLTLEECLGLQWPMSDGLRMEAAMCMWEAVLEEAGNMVPNLKDLLKHKERVGTVQMRHDLMPLVEAVHVGWNIHQMAAKDDPILPFDWGFVPWFLRACVDVAPEGIALKLGWEDLCRVARGGDHG